MKPHNVLVGMILGGLLGLLMYYGNRRLRVPGERVLDCAVRVIVLGIGGISALVVVFLLGGFILALLVSAFR